MKNILAAALLTLCLCGAAAAQESQKDKKLSQFIYVLKLTPRLLDEKNWTKQDGEIVGRHFRRLKRMHGEGRVILAGRTLNESDPSQFGVVIFEAASEAEARKFMEDDAAVREKIMTAQLFPFSVALGR